MARAGGSADGSDRKPVLGADLQYRRLTDHELIEALHRKDSHAFDEFLERYQRVLHAQARRSGVPEAERQEWVSELLNDVALSLIRKEGHLRSSLDSYLAGACRLKLLARHRQESQRKKHLEDALADTASDERVVMEASSQYTVRASSGHDDDQVPLSPALERLASALDESLTPAERLLLVWVGNYVPRRQVAEWLGIEYMAAAQRISRLCRRLRESAIKFAGDLDEPERSELRRFFRRAAVVSQDQLLSPGSGRRGQNDMESINE